MVGNSLLILTYVTDGEAAALLPGKLVNVVLMAEALLEENSSASHEVVPPTYGRVTFAMRVKSRCPACIYNASIWKQRNLKS